MRTRSRRRCPSCAPPPKAPGTGGVSIQGHELPGRREACRLCRSRRRSHGGAAFRRRDARPGVSPPGHRLHRPPARYRGQGTSGHEAVSRVGQGGGRRLRGGPGRGRQGELPAAAPRRGELPSHALRARDRPVPSTPDPRGRGRPQPGRRRLRGCPQVPARRVQPQAGALRDRADAGGDLLGQARREGPRHGPHEADARGVRRRLHARRHRGHGDLPRQGQAARSPRGVRQAPRGLAVSDRIPPPSSTRTSGGIRRAPWRRPRTSSTGRRTRAAPSPRSPCSI